MKPRTTARRLALSMLPLLLVLAASGCATFWNDVAKPILFPRPTPSPVATTAPEEPEEPRATPRPEPRATATAAATATARPTPRPTPSPAVAPRPAAPYICKWKVGDNKPKKAADACHGGVQKRRDGTLKCVKDSTDLYCTDDPLARWPACRPTYPDGSPMSAECTYPTKSGNACLEATCSGGVPLARPRDWGNCSGPARDCAELTSGLLVSCEASGWQTIVIARPGARVRLTTWAPDPSVTCDGQTVPVKPRAATTTWVELVF